MIYTLTLTPYIEKRMHGKVEDYIHFEVDHFTYALGGIGLKTSHILNQYHIDTCSFVLCGSDHLKWIKEEFEKHQMELVYLETDAKAMTSYTYLDVLEDTFSKEKAPIQSISPAHFEILSMMMSEKMEEKGILVFEYDDTQIPLPLMQKEYEKWMKKCDASIISIAPMYYSIFEKHPVNVLVIDKEQVLSLMDIKKEALSSIIEVIKEKVVSLANIVLFPVSCNDFIIFMEGNVYRVNCLIHFASKMVYKEAIFSGIVKCLVEDGDLYKLSEECLSMSIGMSLSEGVKIPSEDAMKMIKNKIHVYQI